MDISTIVAAPRAVEIKHPQTQEPIGLTVNLLPDTDPKILAVKRKWINERLQRGKKTVSAEQIEAQGNAVIEAAVTGWEWRGDLTFEGKKPEFTDANLRRVLNKLPWMRAQIDEELGNEAAFFPS